jgi:hypothetical protein
MANNSTPISDLPKTDNQSNDSQESMMVNSILQDIENDEDINDTNEESLNYTVDTSQIPPKIGNELPSMETIKETTQTIFNQPPTGSELMESQPSELDDFLNKKLEDKPVEIVKESKKEDNILDKIKNILPLLCVVVLFFFLLSLPVLNKLIIKLIPKLSNNGEISILGIFLKTIIMGLVYLVSSIFL